MTAKNSGSPPKFRGVRRRSWGSWVSEIRLPKSRERVWLGSFSSAEEAACAFDAATLLLRGAASPPLKRRRSRPRRGLNLPHLQLAPFLHLSKFDSSFSSDSRAFKSFIRSVAASTVTAALFPTAKSPPDSPSCSVNSSRPSQLHPLIASDSSHSCCDSTTAESTTDDGESSPTPFPSDTWLSSRPLDDVAELRRMDGIELMAVDARFFDEDLTVLRELQDYLAAEPFFLSC